MHVELDDPQHLRAILDSTIDWETVTDAEGRLVYVSPASIDVSGMSHVDILRDTEVFFARVHPDDVESLKQHRDFEVRTHQRGTLRYRLLHAEGRYRWIEHRCGPLHAPTGEYLGQRGSSRDITELVELEERTRLRLAAMEMLTRISTMLVAMPSDEADRGIMDVLQIIGESTHADRCFVGLFGENENEFAVQKMWMRPGLDAVVPPPSPEARHNQLPWSCSTLRRGESIVLGTIDDLPPEAVEERMMLSMLQTRSICITPLRHGDAVVGGLGLSVYDAPLTWTEDVVMFMRLAADLVSGARQRWEQYEAVQRSNARWQYAIEGYGEGLWDADLVTGRTWLSDRYKELLGYGPETLQPNQREMNDFLHPNDRHLMTEHVQRILSAGPDGDQSFELETRMQKRDGSYIWVRHRGMVVERDATSRPLRMIGTIHDITESRRQEAVIARQHVELRHMVDALEVTSRVKDDFITTMSHELRTPLTSIIGLTEVLQLNPGTMTDKQRRFIDVIRASGERLHELIEDIFDVTELEAGTSQLDLSTVRLAEVVHGAIRVVRLRAQQKHQTLACEITPETLEVAADARRLRQILVNLLTNAVTFTPDYGEIHARAGIDDDPAFVRIDVRDTGIGIAEKDLPKLFAPFVRLDTTLTRPTGGSGLGLVITRRLVELHGGTISVASTPGTGSTFTLRLPRAH